MKATNEQGPGLKSEALPRHTPDEEGGTNNTHDTPGGIETEAPAAAEHEPTWAESMRLIESGDDRLLGRIFDPVALGGSSDSQVAELLALRLRHLRNLRFDVTRDVWLQLGEDLDRQPVWQIVPTAPLDYARVHVTETGHCMAHGVASSTEPSMKAKAALRKRAQAAAGIGGLARVLLDVARRPGSDLYVRAGDIDAADDPATIWAGGHMYYLDDAADLDTNPAALTPGPQEPETHVYLRTAMCGPDPSVETPLWDRFLDAVFGDDDEARAYFLAVAGVFVTGTADRVLGVFYGPTGRGKTYAARLLVSLLGSYGHTAPAAILGDHAENAQQAELEGRRLVFVDEGPKGGVQATERLKALTGSALQNTRTLYAKPTLWKPKFNLLMTTNEVPPVADSAVKARLRPVDFTDADPAEVAAVAALLGDPEASKVWRQEGPGVLAQLMMHAGRYLRDRSYARVPGYVAEDLDEMEMEQNPALAWLAERTTDGEAKAGDLHEDFVAWCGRAGIRHPWGRPKWGQAMTAAGYPVRKTKAGNMRPRALKGFDVSVFTGPPTALYVSPGAGADSAAEGGGAGAQLLHPLLHPAGVHSSTSVGSSR